MAAARTYVLHDNDADGFGGAYAAWKVFGTRAKFLHFRHYEELPRFPSDATVYIIDGAPERREQLLSLRERVRRAVVIDHHQSAQGELGDLPDVVIDTSHSAAVLAWYHFHPGKPLPELLRYVEDRDLWRKELPGSDAVSAALESYPRRFEIWEGLDVAELQREGVAILRATEMLVRRICSQAREDYLAGFRIPVVNATAHISDVCHLLLEQYSEAPFAAAYYDLANGGRKWSLRGRGSFDVQEVAQRWGGGGHRSAAGFVVSGGVDLSR